MRVGGFQGQEKGAGEYSILLELAATDDLFGFRTAVEEDNHNVDGFGLWYGRRLGLKKIGLEERTPLMVASMFGSERVLMYILETGNVDINRACGSDEATALHCAVVGGSANVVEVVKLLLDASADANCLDVEGNRPSNLIIPFLSSLCPSKRKMLELMLNDCADFDKACILGDKKDKKVLSPPFTEGKDYLVDLSLPDIKNGMYGSNEFRMYTFKIKSCSRAYSHDWTECPFAHPGENARRRDPRTFHYSCVPCPEFRKGDCRLGDACEYAHGIFECWLHPAQYRTRLCKDEIGCNRKVCFFAHKREELRPLYTSTRSGVPSAKSFSPASSIDFSSRNPLTLGSPSVIMPPSSTAMTTTGKSTPIAASMWSNHSNISPPTLGGSGSRLRTTLSVRDMDFEAELFGKESNRRHQQQLLDELPGLSSLTAWNNPFLSSAAVSASQVYDNGGPSRFSRMKPTNLDDVFGSHDPTIISRLQGLSLDAGTTQLHSRSSYSSSLSSPPARTSQAFGSDLAPAAASASLATKSTTAFAQRSHSFIDRNTITCHSKMPTGGFPDGKLEWGIQKEELNKLGKSTSFGLRRSGSCFGTPAALIPSSTSQRD